MTLMNPFEIVTEPDVDDAVWPSSFETAREADILATLIGHIRPSDPSPDDTAQFLVAHFGSLPQVLAAPIGELRQHGGSDLATALIAARWAVLASLRQDMRRGELLTHYEAVHVYLRARLGAEPVEHVVALFLDIKNRLIRDEVMSVGTPSGCALEPRQILARALQLNASALIIAHNHPSGDPTPSRSDIVMTSRLTVAAKALGMALHDHYIVTAVDIYSLRAHGHFPKDTPGT